VSRLEVAGLDSFATVRFRPACCVGEEGLDFIFECVVGIAANIQVVGRVSDSGFDNKICHRSVSASSTLQCVGFVLISGHYVINFPTTISIHNTPGIFRWEMACSGAVLGRVGDDGFELCAERAITLDASISVNGVGLAESFDSERLSIFDGHGEVVGFERGFELLEFG
jgi:hypothetical protein